MLDQRLSPTWGNCNSSSRVRGDRLFDALKWNGTDLGSERTEEFLWQSFSSFRVYSNLGQALAA